MAPSLILGVTNEDVLLCNYLRGIVFLHDLM